MLPCIFNIPVYIKVSVTHSHDSEQDELFAILCGDLENFRVSVLGDARSEFKIYIEHVTVVVYLVTFASVLCSSMFNTLVLPLPLAPLTCCPRFCVLLHEIVSPAQFLAIWEPMFISELARTCSLIPSPTDAILAPLSWAQLTC